MSAAVPVALVIVVAARFLLAPMRDVPDYDNADFSRFVAVRKYEVEERKEQPLVIVSGSSRTQYGIYRPALGEAMNVPAARIANLSLPSGNPWTTLEITKGVNAGFLLVDIAPIQFNASIAPNRNRFAHVANWSDRLAIDHHPDKAGFILDEFTGHLGIRRSLRSYGLAAINHRRGTIWGADDRERLDPIWLKETDHKKLRDDLFAENTAWKAENFHLETFRDWIFSDFLFSKLKSLATEAKVRGTVLILHQPPFHPVYMENLRQHPAYTEYRKKMLSLADESTTLLLFENAEETGITPDQILDYGHFGREAAEIYSRHLGKIAAQKQSS